MKEIHAAILLYLIINLHTILCSEISNYNKPNGIIKETLWPKPGNYLKRTWTINRPNRTITTLRVLNFDIKQCTEEKLDCENNYLLIGDLNENTKLCAGNRSWFSIKKRQINIDFHGFGCPANVWISFALRNEDECPNNDFKCNNGNGCFDKTDICDEKFHCTDHSDEVGCSNCDQEHTPCDAWSSICYSPRQRCDKVLDCPRGEDELDCNPQCPDTIECNSTANVCITPLNICDGTFDCDNGYDEVTCARQFCQKPHYFQCPNGKCIRAPISSNDLKACSDLSIESDQNHQFLLPSIAAAVFILTATFLKLSLKWFSTRRDVETLLQNLPQFPTPAFCAPGGNDYENIRLINCQNINYEFSHTDFRVGGEIYEAFVRAKRSLNNDSKINQQNFSDERKESIYHNQDDKEEEVIIKVLVSLSLPYFMCSGLSPRISESLRSLQESRITCRDNKEFRNL